MNSKLNQPWQPWVPIDKIDQFVQVEPALLILGLAFGAWVLYKVLLRGVSAQRHKNLNRHFANLAFHAVLGCALFFLYYGLTHFSPDNVTAERIAAYVGFLAILSGATVIVKTARIVVFEYLFLSHMREGVPLLLVNLFTLLLSITLGAWIVTDIFNIRLAPLLATSAIFSLVLGLALQDTLGNLFAGVALQFDKPYEIGDWIEVQSGSQKWVGQVIEVSWRATVLIGFGDESITIPNRVMGQSQVSNFSLKTRPIIRSHVFKVRYDSDFEDLKRLLSNTALEIPDIKRNPAPFVLLLECMESWVTCKLVYFIDDYGRQFIIGDQVLTLALRNLAQAEILLAEPRLRLVGQNELV